MEDVQPQAAGLCRQFVQEPMNRKIVHILATAFLMTASVTAVMAQEYVAPQVVVSKEKVRSGGKVYYSHVVLERQTLFSISKAYGVTIEEIYESNPTLNLEKEGLKKNQILMIPVKDTPSSDKPVEKVEEETVKEQVGNQVPQVSKPTVGDDYFIHKVKWFEDLDAIAKKYDVSKESIININGLTSDKIKRKQELKIPRHPEYWEGRTVIHREEEDEDVTEVETPVQEAIDTAEREHRGFGDFFDDLFVKEGHHDVDISMLIPFSSPRAGDRVSFMDFYSGALLAARTMGNQGTNVDIHSYDVTGGNISMNRERFSESNFVIGPVSKDDIIKAASASDGSTWIISPLDMQVESLADSLSNLIQAPTPTSVQIRDMVNWIRSDMRSGDRVIVITPVGQQQSSYAQQVENELSAAGVNHATTTVGSMSSYVTNSGTNRIILACDYNERSTVFLIEAIRHLYLMAGRSNGTILYSTSRIRTYDQIDVEQLHKLNLHASVTYFVDYDSKDVKDFLLQYRALFKAEPSRSAYSGYDLMKYFSTLASKYGNKWYKALDRVDFTGLQSDFKLERTPSGSFVNNAVRRVVYNPDFSISLVR